MLIYAAFFCFANMSYCSLPPTNPAAGPVLTQLYSTLADCQRHLPPAPNGYKYACFGRHINTWSEAQP